MRKFALFELAMGLLILNKHRRVKLGLLGIAAVQLYLYRKDFDRTFLETIGAAFHRKKNKTYTP